MQSIRTHYKQINSLQLRHNNEIKDLQNAPDNIKVQIGTNAEENNSRMKEELKSVNDKLTSQIALVNNQLHSGLTKMKKDMTEFMAEYITKFTTETKTAQEETTNK